MARPGQKEYGSGVPVEAPQFDGLGRSIGQTGLDEAPLHVLGGALGLERKAEVLGHVIGQ